MRWLWWWWWWHCFKSANKSLLFSRSFVLLKVDVVAVIAVVDAAFYSCFLFYSFHKKKKKCRFQFHILKNAANKRIRAQERISHSILFHSNIYKARWISLSLQNKHQKQNKSKRLSEQVDEETFNFRSTPPFRRSH